MKLAKRQSTLLPPGPGFPEKLWDSWPVGAPACRVLAWPQAGPVHTCAWTLMTAGSS